MFDEKRITQEEINSALQEVLECCGITTIISNDGKKLDVIDTKHPIVGGSFKLEDNGREIFESDLIDGYRAGRSANNLSPRPGIMWLAKKILTKDEYKQILKRPYNQNIFPLLCKHIWLELVGCSGSLKDFLSDLILWAYYLPDENTLLLTTDVEDSFDAIKWYTIYSDGSCCEKYCDCEPYYYSKGTFLQVINKARKIYNSKNIWQKIINRILNRGSFRFNNQETYLLFDEFEWYRY